MQAKITINHAQIQGTENRVFDNLQQTLEQFVNDRQWTNLQFRKNERIVCNFNITVSKYDKDQNIFTCKAVIQAIADHFDGVELPKERPVDVGLITKESLDEAAAGG